MTMSERLTDRPTPEQIAELERLERLKAAAELWGPHSRDAKAFGIALADAAHWLLPWLLPLAKRGLEADELQGKLDAAHDPKSVGNIAWLAEQYKLRAEKAEAERDALRERLEKMQGEWEGGLTKTVEKIMDVNPLRITVPYIKEMAREQITKILSQHKRTNP